MLVMFRTKNYNSFKEDVILDLRKASYTQHPSHVFKCGKHELLKTIAIYGANASGKSNLISAISEFGMFIVSSFFNSSSKETDEENRGVRLNSRPFMLTDEIDNKIEYEMVFYNNNHLYQYGYIIEDKTIFEEWLIYDDELVYEREENNIIFGERYKYLQDKYNKSRADRLFISVLDYFATESEVIDIMDSFKEFFEDKLSIYLQISFECSIKGFREMVNVASEKFNKDEHIRQKISEYVNKIDVGIKEIIVEKKTLLKRKTNEKKDIDILQAIHDVYNKEGYKVKEVAFGLEYESSGTKRFISIMEQLVEMMDSGGVFIIDEISARLHPLVTKFIIDLYQSALNKNNSQLIFTTHDIYHMNKEQFRRDEIVLVDKSITGESKIYSLADLDVRSDASFDRDYFKGKYGAIPIIKDFI